MHNGLFNYNNELKMFDGKSIEFSWQGGRDFVYIEKSTQIVHIHGPCLEDVPLDLNEVLKNDMNQGLKLDFSGNL